MFSANLRGLRMISSAPAFHDYHCSTKTFSTKQTPAVLPKNPLLTKLCSRICLLTIGLTGAYFANKKEEIQLKDSIHVTEAERVKKAPVLEKINIVKASINLFE